MIIGLIGGIGSGKSTISAYLEDKYNFTVLRADDIVKEMEKPGGRLYDKLVKAFGERILCEGEGADRPIDREAFAKLIYRDKAILKKVNEIIHPAAWEVIAVKTRGEGNYVVETALPDKDFPSRCDEVWYVYADKRVRIERLVKSRAYSREKCINIIKNQLNEKEFLALSDKMIDNSGSILDSFKKIDKLMNERLSNPDGTKLMELN